MATDTYDVIVIGGGPVGENAAQYAIEGTDLTACIVETELLGGECSYYACMPSKALLRPVEVAATTRHLRGVSDAAIDRAALLARRDEWVSNYDDSGQVEWAEGAGIEVIRGYGRVSGERQVRVTSEDGDRDLTARHAVIIATGSQPVVPSEYAAALPWGSRDATGVVDVPGRLAIIGGGVVACEAATWLNALGSAVTMVVRGSRVLDGQEPFASDVTLDSLRGQGITVRLDTSVTEVSRVAASDTGIGRVHGGPVTLRLESSAGDGPRELETDEMLLAIGRTPRVDDVGVDLDGPLPEWLHVIGDASHDAPLTHIGKYTARVVGAQIAAAAGGLAPDGAPRDVPVPQVIFTDPQVASVGLTAAKAREAGTEVITSHVEWNAASGAALLQDDATGGATLVVDADKRTVVGATFVGPGAGELLHAATMAVVGELPIHLLRQAVPSYPTASELWLRLLEQLPRELRSPAN